MRVSEPGRTILVVDDDGIFRDLARGILERHYYRVLAAESPAAAQKLIEAHKPDLILLDVHMGAEDGIVYLARLKSNPVLRSIPVILLTADSGKDVVARAVRAGALDYIVKPIREDTLIGRIARAMQVSDLEQLKEAASGGTLRLERRAGITKFLFTGNLDPGTIARLRDTFTHGLRAQARNDEIVLDFRFQTVDNQAHLQIIRAIIEFFKPVTPRIIAGRNYGALMALDLDFENQVFLSPDDLVQYLQFQSGQKRKKPSEAG